MQQNIHKVEIEDNFYVYARLLNEAFSTVAADFGLTQENCPTNNAFITGEDLKSQLTDNKEFYYSVQERQITGFIAIEKSHREDSLFYIEKLAVYPDYRHKGIGKYLMDFALKRIIGLGGTKVSVGLIDSNTVLKEWYGKQGFKETVVKTFSHLPFDVCYMEKSLTSI